MGEDLDSRTTALKNIGKRATAEPPRENARELQSALNVQKTEDPQTFAGVWAREYI